MDRPEVKDCSPVGKWFKLSIEIVLRVGAAIKTNCRQCLKLHLLVSLKANRTTFFDVLVQRRVIAVGLTSKLGAHVKRRDTASRVPC